MATETATDVERSPGSGWLGGALAGVLAGIVFGAMMQMMMPDILTGAIPAMYGFDASVAIGWALHLFHSAVFGLVYAAVVRLDALEAYATTATSGTALGIGYGLVIWVLAASIVMPIWVGAVTGMSPPVPNVNPMSLVGHVVYGAVLGAAYPLLADAF